MPFIDLFTHRLNYRLDGREGAPWLTFCNSLGTDLSMWDPQVEALAPHFRILRYDRRGHGRSSSPPGLAEIGDLGRDVLALWSALDIRRTHFCGLSLGGLTGQWLALNAADRLDRLVLCATAAKIGTVEGWVQRVAQVRADGLAMLREGTSERWFTPAFAARQPGIVGATLDAFEATSPEGYAACCHAVGSADFRDRLRDIAVPVLAVAGDDDPVCPPADLQWIAQETRHGRFVQVHGRHLCNLESPADFNAVVGDFLC